MFNHKNTLTTLGVILSIIMLLILSYNFIPYQILNNNNLNGVNKFEGDQKYFAQEIVYNYQFNKDVTGIHVNSIEKVVPDNDTQKLKSCFGDNSWQGEKREIKEYLVANISLFGHYGIPIKNIKLDCYLKEV